MNWVKFEDKTPDQDGLYLCYDNSGDIRVEIFDKDLGKFIYSECCRDGILNIAYWAELPEKPNV